MSGSGSDSGSGGSGSGSDSGSGSGGSGSDSGSGSGSSCPTCPPNAYCDTRKGVCHCYPGYTGDGEQYCEGMCILV